MRLYELIERRKITKYRLAQASGVPYSTLSDILKGKTDLKKCSAETLYRLAKALNISMESLLEPYFDERCSFEIFKSNVCHKLKEMGDVSFLLYILENDIISKYYLREWYPESLYLLAMVDYLSRLNGIPLCTKYDKLRGKKLPKILYPASIQALSLALKSDEPKKKAERDSIPEFIRFNIVESEVRNVI